MNDQDMNEAEAVAPLPEEQGAQEQATVSADTGKEADGLKAEIAELKDKLLRAYAETENVRRRMDREREDVGKFAVSKFAQALLPVADNLRRAIEAVPAEQHGSEIVKRVIEGIEATERALLQAFEKANIVRIEAMDQPFDPNFHEVMIEIDHPEKTAGTIVQLFEPGYRIHERLLRPARVGIAKGAQRERMDTSA